MNSTRYYLQHDNDRSRTLLTLVTHKRHTIHRPQGAVSIRKTVLLGMVIPMLKIRRPTGRLIFNMGIPIPGKTVFYIETGPRTTHLWAPLLCKFCVEKWAWYFTQTHTHTHIYIYIYMSYLSWYWCSGLKSEYTDYICALVCVCSLLTLYIHTSAAYIDWIKIWLYR